MQNQNYGYIYKVTNKANNKSYIGKRVKTVLDTKYYGSGNLIKQAILKYGIDNFEREVLTWCKTKLCIESCEKKYIKEHKPEYNLTEGGTGGTTLGFKGKKHKPESMRKMLETKKMRYTPEELKAFASHRKSKETKEKLRLLKLGVANSLESRTKVSNTLKKKYANGDMVPYFLGKKQSVESNRKRSIALMGIKRKPMTEIHKEKAREAQKYGTHIRWHSNRNVRNESCNYCEQ